jgi:ATP-dependent 26S proteasome regulatory subunit
MVRDVFRLARENAPAIIFIDEIDAIATKRFDAQTGADRYATSTLPLALHCRHLMFVV